MLRVRSMQNHIQRSSSSAISVSVSAVASQGRSIEGRGTAHGSASPRGTRVSSGRNTGAHPRGEHSGGLRGSDRDRRLPSGTTVGIAAATSLAAIPASVSPLLASEFLRRFGSSGVHGGMPSILLGERYPLSQLRRMKIRESPASSVPLSELFGSIPAALLNLASSSAARFSPMSIHLDPLGVRSTSGMMSSALGFDTPQPLTAFPEFHLRGNNSSSAAPGRHPRGTLRETFEGVRRRPYERQARPETPQQSQASGSSRLFGILGEMIRLLRSLFFSGDSSQ